MFDRDGGVPKGGAGSAAEGPRAGACRGFLARVSYETQVKKCKGTAFAEGPLGFVTVPLDGPGTRLARRAHASDAEGTPMDRCPGHPLQHTERHPIHTGRMSHADWAKGVPPGMQAQSHPTALGASQAASSRCSCGASFDRVIVATYASALCTSVQRIAWLTLHFVVVRLLTCNDSRSVLNTRCRADAGGGGGCHRGPVCCLVIPRVHMGSTFQEIDRMVCPQTVREHISGM